LGSRVRLRPSLYTSMSSSQERIATSGLAFRRAENESADVLESTATI
jgi:hypothetical protein